MLLGVKLCHSDGSVQETNVRVVRPRPGLTVDALVERTAGVLRKQFDVTHKMTEIFDVEWQRLVIVGSDDRVDDRANYVLTFDATRSYSTTAGNTVNDELAGI
ncbi:hypothetical protein AAVH_39478 [Aphelenchoides avenae]|nr:hypothetical protein AAVH_39478 [Aphelenchus avenae]